MNRKIILLLLVACLSFSSYAEVYMILSSDGSFIKSVSLPKVNRTESQGDNSITISYTFPGTAFVAGSTDPKRLTAVIDGFSTSQSENSPLIPVKTEFIHVPANGSATLEILDSLFVGATLPLAPAPPMLLEDEAYYDPAPVSTDYKFAHKCVEVSKTASYRGEKILCVNINPIKYNESTRRLEALKRVTFKITFDSKAAGTSIPTDDYFFNHKVSKLSTSFIDLNNSKLSPRRMLILTVPRFEQPLDTFVIVKKKFGIDVNLVSKNNWTSASIKEEIKAKAQEYPDLFYVLLVGNTNYLPTNPFLQYDLKLGGYYYSDTDYPYGCLTDSSLVNELCLGRIPVNNETECTSIISKLIQYHYNPGGDYKYTRALVTGYYEDENKDSYEDRRFMKTCCEVYDSLDNIFTYRSRCYKTDIGVIPIYFSKKPFSEGGLLPEEMRASKFPWQSGPSDITKIFDAGVNLVTHRGHGTKTQWHAPVFKSSDASKLSNTVHPIILSIECSTANNFASDCLAYSFLKNKSGGASSVIAATNPTLTYSNDVLLHGILDAFWINHGFKAPLPDLRTPAPNDEKLVSLGEMLRYGNMNVGEVFNFNSDYYRSSCRLYHVIGDPSLIPFDDAATNVADSVKIDFTSVKSTNPNTIVAIYDKRNDRVYRYVGSDVRCKDAQIMLNDAVIIIPGKKPYVAQLRFDIGLGKSMNLSSNSLSVEWETPEDATFSDKLEINVVNVLDGSIIDTSVVDINAGSLQKHFDKPLKGLHSVSVKLGEKILESKTYNL